MTTTDPLTRSIVDGAHRKMRLAAEIQARAAYRELSLWQKLMTTPPPGWRWVSVGSRWS